MPRNIPALTGLRAIAAFWVFLYHALALTKDLGAEAKLPLAAIGSSGYLGVDIFFVLSGFVIAHHYADDMLHRKPLAYAAFLWKRLVRIYPAYITALLIVALILTFVDPHPKVDLSMTSLLESLAMIQAWPLHPKIVWNPVAWSLSCEWAAYIVFPLIACSTRKLNITTAALWILTLYLALHLAVKYGGPDNADLPRVAAGFTAGVIVYRIWTLKAIPINLASGTALVGMIFVTGWLDRTLGPPTSMKNAPILSCFIVYGIASGTGLLKRTAQRLEHAGCLSYSFYLVHYAVLQVGYEVLARLLSFDSALAVYSVIGLSLAMSIAAASFLYKYVEQPAREYLVAKLNTSSGMRTRTVFSSMAPAAGVRYRFFKRKH